MALSDSDRPADMLDSRLARLAGAVSIALILAGIAAMVCYLIDHWDSPGWILVVMVIKIIVAFVLIGIGVQLVRGRSWAQQALLIFWLIALADSLIMLLSVVLWGPPQWFNDISNWPVAYLATPVLGASIVAVVLLVRASAATSRLRYASMVSVSLVVALTVAIVANMIAQDDYYRKDIETLGRYGLSDRSKEMLASFDEKLRLTCVYTSTEQGKLGEKYCPRVLELLDEIGETRRHLGKDVVIENVATVAQKTRLDARLRDRQLAACSEHIKVLEEFLARAENIIKGLEEEQKLWAGMSDDSYLMMWGSSVQMTELLKEGTEKTIKARGEVQTALKGSGLPNYAKLISQVKESLSDTYKKLTGISARIALISNIPATAVERRDKTLAALQASRESVEQMTAVVKFAEDEPVAEPAKVLENFAASARNAAKRLRTSADMLGDLAGSGNSYTIRTSLPFRTIITIAGYPRSTDLVEILYDYLAKPIEDMASDTEAVVKNAKASYQLEVIGHLHEKSAEHLKDLEMVCEIATTAIDKLATVDEPARKLFEAAENKRLFKSITEPMSQLLAMAAKLPPIKDEALPTDLAEDNIVIIEVGDKIKVATFDEVYPRQSQPLSPLESAGDQKRVFNGDSAIGTKILGMSHKPFATVLLTYYKPRVPPQLARSMMPAPLEPEQLTTLISDLSDANFDIKHWNLLESKPEVDDSIPQVLIVLPPPPTLDIRMGGFDQVELNRIRSEIDSGTPAVFVAMYLPSLQMPTYHGMTPISIRRYEHLGKYLRDDWGIEVFNEHRVMKGEPDTNQPGRFKVNVLAYFYLPISTFTKHPIGRPLWGQRVLWLDACPLLKAKEKDGITVESVLTIPPGNKAMWATVDVAQLFRNIQRQQHGFITPNYEAGDLPAPMDLVLAACRSEDKENKRSAARIVVVGVGRSFGDDYLNESVPVLDSKGGFSYEEPPSTNAELIVNSLYWLSGHERFIAAGPARIKPIADIDKTTDAVIKALCLGALPLIILVAGGIVMFVRRR